MDHSQEFMAEKSNAEKWEPVHFSAIDLSANPNASGIEILFVLLSI
jgi:hypothetical protein